MKLIVAGSRKYNDERYLKYIIPILDEFERVNEITEVISGMAKGPDLIGCNWAKSKNIPVKEFYPDWKLHGKRAGLLRNTEMAKYGDNLVAFWDGESRGTSHMIRQMEELGKPYFIVRLNNE